MFRPLMTRPNSTIKQLLRSTEINTLRIIAGKSRQDTVENEDTKGMS